MLANNNKRKILFGEDDFPQKKFKVNDSSEDELQIDLDFDSVIPSLTRPLDFDSFSVSLSSGRRCYVKYRDNNDTEIGITPHHRTETASANYYRLLDEVEANIMKKRSQPIKDINVVVHNDNALWVDKYSPKRYGDLLSNETVNRGLLTWIKLWDKYVFNKESLVSMQNIGNEECFQVSEIDKRPLKKAVLLSGPPGIGKTTLAQILATHCGYKVLEMNASNERSPEQFAQKIELMYTSLHLTESEFKMKPSCLILDEIDGTSLAAINVLINAMNTTHGESNKKSGKRSGKLSIKTPVICICNDPYALSLKNLRPLCYLIRVGTPDYSQMLFRISDICSIEGLNCDRTVLNHLIESSNRDIRSCLNTLQFLKQKGKKEITIKDLESLNIGNKDVQNGIFNVWEEIFTSTSLKSSYALSEGRGTSEASQRCTNILKLAQSAGDLDRIINGIHENYLSLVRFKDVHLEQLSESTEWMVFNDVINQNIASSQLYQLMKYKQYVVPYFHLSFASSTIVNKRISWPSSDLNAHLAKQKMIQTFQTFMANQTLINPWFHDKHDVIKTVLPHLSHIIRPHTLRPINTQLYTNNEKIILQNTVAIMISTGLEYVQERLGELQFQYVLQPNIDTIIEFDLSVAPCKPLTYACKQLIANEIKAEKIRKYAIVTPVVSERPQNRMSVILQKEKAMTTNATLLGSKLKATPFSFQIEKRSSDSGSNKELNPITTLLNQTMQFRFKEGCTNAIRRMVKMKDL